MQVDAGGKVVVEAIHVEQKTHQVIMENQRTSRKWLINLAEWTEDASSKQGCLLGECHAGLQALFGGCAE